MLARHGALEGHTSWKKAPAEEVSGPISPGSSLEHLGHVPSLPSWGHRDSEEQFFQELVLGVNPCEWTLKANLLPIISSFLKLLLQSVVTDHVNPLCPAP